VSKEAVLNRPHTSLVLQTRVHEPGMERVMYF